MKHNKKSRADESFELLHVAKKLERDHKVACGTLTMCEEKVAPAIVKFLTGEEVVFPLNKPRHYTEAVQQLTWH